MASPFAMHAICVPVKEDAANSWYRKVDGPSIRLVVALKDKKVW